VSLHGLTASSTLKHISLEVRDIANIHSQMAHEMKQALHVVHRLTTVYSEGRAQLWLPHLNTAWLGVAPSSYALYEPGATLSLDHEGEYSLESEANLTTMEARQGLLENSYTGLGTGFHDRIYSTSTAPFKTRVKWSIRDLPHFVHSLWSSGPSMYIRLLSNSFIRSIQHSSHVKHALKNVVGVAILSFPAFLSPDMPGQSDSPFLRGFM
jgi:hypothetical protein